VEAPDVGGRLVKISMKKASIVALVTMALLAMTATSAAA
jgi:hypothetical protein